MQPLGRTVPRPQCPQLARLAADLEVEALVDILHALPIYRILTSRGDPASIAQVPDAYMPLLTPGISSSVKSD